jgi:hypothetical protein
MNTDIIEMTYCPNNVSVTVNAEESNQNNSTFCGRAIATLNDSSFVGFVIGGTIGALIGVPIAFAKGFNSSYSDISESSAIALILTTYFTGCFLGAYYKPIFSACKQIVTKNYTSCYNTSVTANEN